MSLNLDTSQRSATTLSVISKSDTTQYVRVVLKEVIHPATQQEQERDVANWQGKGIVVSPLKFALPAGATKTIRIISLEKPNTERIYRAYFEPVSGEKNQDQTQSNMQAKVALTLVWGVLIRQLPEKSVVSLQRDAQLPGVINNGTVRVRIRGYSQCSSPKRDNECNWKTVPQGIYPGEKLRLPGTNPAQPLHIRYLTENDQIQSLTLP